MKLAKTVQLDVSDQHTFTLAAEPGEWAITGTFAFADMTPEAFSNKDQLAFRNGWLGTGSFGRSTFVQISTIPDSQFEEVVRSLAAHLHREYGAPDMLAAVEAARLEVSDMSDLCGHPTGTLLAIEREFSEGGIRERVRVLEREDPARHATMWEISEP